MKADVAQSRTVAATTTVLTITGQDSDGEPADPGTVTVQVTDSTGTDIKAAGTATAESGNNRTVTLTAVETASVDLLTAVWSDGTGVIQTTKHEIVGGVYCTVATIRADTAVGDVTDHPSAALIADRNKIETLIESVCHRAFVPRWNREILSGNGTSRTHLYWPNLRSVILCEYWSGSTWTDLGVNESNIPANDTGVVVLRDGCFPIGDHNIRVTYRHGLDRPPPDLADATARAIAYYRVAEKSGIPDRAISIQGTEMGNIILATPGLGRWVTGMPMIDEVLNRPGYRFHRPAVG